MNILMRTLLMGVVFLSSTVAQAQYFGAPTPHNSSCPEGCNYKECKYLQFSARRGEGNLEFYSRGDDSMAVSCANINCKNQSCDAEKKKYDE